MLGETSRLWQCAYQCSRKFPKSLRDVVIVRQSSKEQSDHRKRSSDRGSGMWKDHRTDLPEKNPTIDLSVESLVSLPTLASGTVW